MLEDYKIVTLEGYFQERIFPNHTAYTEYRNQLFRIAIFDQKEYDLVYMYPSDTRFNDSKYCIGMVKDKKRRKYYNIITERKSGKKIYIMP